MARSVAEEVLGLLADGEAWTGRELAHRLGVGLRTVRRAIADLRSEGVSIDADPGRGGGLRLARRVGVPRLRLENDEAVGLLVAVAVAESVGLPLLGGRLRTLRAKLTATFHERDRGPVGHLRKRILVGASASARIRDSWRQPQASVSRTLQQAFVTQRVISIRYRDESQRTTERPIEPQYLLLNHPAWYVLAHDRATDAGRTFRLDRIDEVALEAEKFKVRRATDLATDIEVFFAPL